MISKLEVTVFPLLIYACKHIAQTEEFLSWFQRRSPEAPEPPTKAYESVTISTTSIMFWETAAVRLFLRALFNCARKETDKINDRWKQTRRLLQTSWGEAIWWERRTQLHLCARLRSLTICDICCTTLLVAWIAEPIMYCIVPLSKRPSSSCSQEPFESHTRAGIARGSPLYFEMFKMKHSKKRTGLA